MQVVRHTHRRWAHPLERCRCIAFADDRAYDLQQLLTGEEKCDASTIDGTVSADGPRPRFTIESGVSLQRRTPGGLSIHDRGESSEAGAGGG